MGKYIKIPTKIVWDRNERDSSDRILARLTDEEFDKIERAKIILRLVEENRDYYKSQLERKGTSHNIKVTNASTTIHSVMNELLDTSLEMTKYNDLNINNKNK